MTGKEVVALQNWWIGELKKIRGQIMLEEDKRRAKVRTKYAKTLEDYRNKNDILDAYGFGIITERKYDRLIELWEEREKSQYPDEMFHGKLDLIDELMQVAIGIIQDNRKAVEE